MKTLTDIEQGIVAVLKPLEASHGVRVAPYAGETSDAGKASAKLPAVLVAFSASEDIDNGPRQLERQFWAVIVLTNASRAVEEAASEAYRLLEAVRVKLAGAVVAEGLTPMLRLRQEMVLDGRTQGYAATYYTQQAYLA